MEFRLKPTLIFLPGGWHTPECFEPVTKILSNAGYEIDNVAFPSIGTELRGSMPLQGWAEDVKIVRQTVLAHLELGKEVVLIVHSYSGTVGSEAVQGLGKTEWQRLGGKGGVIRLVYLTALALPIGGWIWE